MSRKMIDMRRGSSMAHPNMNIANVQSCLYRGVDSVLFFFDLKTNTIFRFRNVIDHLILDANQIKMCSLVNIIKNYLYVNERTVRRSL